MDIKKFILKCNDACIVTVYNENTTPESYYEDIDAILHEDDTLDGIYFGDECIIDDSNINDVAPINNTTNGFTLGDITFFLYKGITN